MTWLWLLLVSGCLHIGDHQNPSSKEVGCLPVLLTRVSPVSRIVPHTDTEQNVSNKWMNKRNEYTFEFIFAKYPYSSSLSQALGKPERINWETM